MPKVCVCVDPMFKPKNQPALEVLETLSKAGFSAYEFWSWKNHNLEGEEEAIVKTGVQLVAMSNTHQELIDPEQREQYLQALAETIEVAGRMNCPNIIVTVGNERFDMTREQQIANIIEGLKSSVPMLEKSGKTLVLEPLNVKINHKGHFLSRSSEAFDIVKKVNSAHVKVLFDIYHQQITEGDLIRNITENIDLIGHFHLADNPGRHEPGTGEINCAKVLEAIFSTDYSGYLGLEYRPSIEDRLESLLYTRKMLGLS